MPLVAWRITDISVEAPVCSSGVIEVQTFGTGMVSMISRDQGKSTNPPQAMVISCRFATVSSLID